MPIIWCSAEPSSHVTGEAFAKISGMIVNGVQTAGPVDGLYLDLHGAMVTEHFEDGEGELLRRIRAALGDRLLPIAVSLDLHANLTAPMVHAASVITIFRTYPHIDMAETGRRAFAPLQRLMAGERLYAAWRQAPFLVPLQAQFTGASPCRELYHRLVRSEMANGIATADIAMGFPAADIHDAGPSLIAYATDPVPSCSPIHRTTRVPGRRLIRRA